MKSFILGFVTVSFVTAVILIPLWGPLLAKNINTPKDHDWIEAKIHRIGKFSGRITVYQESKSEVTISDNCKAWKYPNNIVSIGASDKQVVDLVGSKVKDGDFIRYRRVGGTLEIQIQTDKLPGVTYGKKMPEAK